jgi:YegS/Rv2252/BmrU family lipid kinase
MERLKIKKLCLILNPKAGSQDHEAVLKLIHTELDRLQIKHLTYRSEYKGAISNFIQNENLEGFEGICVIGGDGTINEAVNGLMKSGKSRSIALGIIPRGSGNAFAEDLGELTPLGALKTILKGYITPIDLFKIDHKGEVSFAINIIGWGMAAEVNILAEKLRWLGGIRYSIASLLGVLRMKKKRLEFVLDDTSFNGEGLFFLALNTIHTGKGMQMAPYAILNDGLIDIVLVKSASKLRVIKIFTQLFSGKHINDPHVEYKQIRHFTLNTEGDPLNIDGENIGKTPIQAELIHKGIKIFANL